MPFNNTLGPSRFKRSLAAAAISALLGGVSISTYAASDSYGEIGGTVIEHLGDELTQATIIIRHQTKGFTRQVTTNSDGEFVLKSLPLGSYTITISKDGYESVSQENIKVSLGNRTPLNATLKTLGTNTLVISGAAVSKIDTSSSQRGINLSAEELELLPIGEDLTSVALMAPGNALGDSGIFSGISGSSGRLVASQGGSVAENAYFLNGTNITDVRYNALISDFPWELVSEVQVITGGIPAQYGRTVGSVTNLVAKSGDNEFRYGIKVDWQPEGLSAQAPDFNFLKGDGTGWTNHIRNSENSSDRKEYSLYASGPLIEDKMFFYVLYSPDKVDSEWAAAGEPEVRKTFRERKTDRAFVNLDWEVTDGHSITFMMMDSAQDVTDNQFFWHVANGLGDPVNSDPNIDNTFTYDTRISTINYSGYLTDRLSVSSTYGKLSFDSDLRTGTPDLAPLSNCTTGTCIPIGNWVGSYDSVNSDEREEFRIDFELELDDHTISFGYTEEESNSKTLGAYHGPNRRLEQIWHTTAGGTRWSDSGVDIVLPPNSDYRWTREFTKDVNVDSGSSAFYIEDSWQATDALVVTFGIRNEHFWNKTNDGDKWIDLKDQIAPRLQLNYDLAGDGSQKVYFNWGRYYQPVAQRVSERFTAPEIDVRTYALVDSYNADGTPNVGPILGTQTVGNGEVRPGQIYAADNLKPMYLDSFSLGYEFTTENNWLLGVRYTHRDLKRSIEDSAIDTGVLAWCADTGRDCTGFEAVAGQVWNGGQARVWNPGSDLSIWEDFDGDGTLELETIPSSYLGYPKAERTYQALEFTFDGQVSENFNLSGSYTYSKSEGNIEGLVRSDNDQRDPGWTRAFDEPQITDFGFGRLPNDRPHSFKLWGLYQLDDQWSTSFNYQAFSGRPINHFGYHPELRSWGAEYNYRDEVPVPRGTAGRTPFQQNLSVNLNYLAQLFEGDLNITITVFNPFNWSKVTQVEEVGELSARQDLDNDGVYETPAERNYLWGTPTGWQAPRYVELSVRYEF
ncbi:TonB-dependent receptor [Pleionea sp. CnH1-48]|uniref:TonB-dependent receptor n=1 Tax=Pleionea sp. CnH1-48 TaxID=2954494 RepID=UPI002096EBE0|nr:TonB-dependent receptor [Pleionea sp. CnH1-48]MCO7226451.1 TonB-dependent receptor [Pleionea sp. CnH1-48]